MILFNNSIKNNKLLKDGNKLKLLVNEYNKYVENLLYSNKKIQI